jgi:hypothetical protein
MEKAAPEKIANSGEPRLRKGTAGLRRWQSSARTIEDTEFLMLKILSNRLLGHQDIAMGPAAPNRDRR